MHSVGLTAYEGKYESLDAVFFYCFVKIFSRQFVYHTVVSFLFLHPIFGLGYFYFLMIYCIAEFAAFAPSAAAVMICLSSFVLTSPATKNPGTDVTPSSPALM